MADIGKPQRDVEVIPFEDPVPRELPLEPAQPAPPVEVPGPLVPA